MLANKQKQNLSDSKLVLQTLIQEPEHENGTEIKPDDDDDIEGMRKACEEIVDG